MDSRQQIPSSATCIATKATIMPSLNTFTATCNVINKVLRKQIALKAAGPVPNFTVLS